MGKLAIWAASMISGEKRPSSAVLIEPLHCSSGGRGGRGGRRGRKKGATPVPGLLRSVVAVMVVGGWPLVREMAEKW